MFPLVFGRLIRISAQIWSSFLCDSSKSIHSMCSECTLGIPLGLMSSPRSGNDSSSFSVSDQSSVCFRHLGLHPVQFDGTTLQSSSVDRPYSHHRLRWTQSASMFRTGDSMGLCRIENVHIRIFAPPFTVLRFWLQQICGL